jgi:cyclopropane fatty-acyl-phospholipid synthase-like methyltransferase
MEGINSYWKQLTAEEIAAREHRRMVGGFWEEIGSLQFNFLKQRGLQPEHTLLDVGCGALRGGVHFIRYLQADRYHGLDLNASLVEAGKAELAAAGLQGKCPRLLVDDQFRFTRFGERFDFAVAISVFTHLFLNHIARCLREVRNVLQPAGRFYATFFEAPRVVHLEPLTHQPGGITTYYDSDPFHYARDELAVLAGNAGLSVEYVGEWQHPRAQKMVCFRPVPDAEPVSGPRRQ